MVDFSCYNKHTPDTQDYYAAKDKNTKVMAEPFEAFNICLWWKYTFRAHDKQHLWYFFGLNISCDTLPSHPCPYRNMGWREYEVLGC